jgi:hypothetical protein
MFDGRASDLESTIQDHQSRAKSYCNATADIIAQCAEENAALKRSEAETYCAHLFCCSGQASNSGHGRADYQGTCT